MILPPLDMNDPAQACLAAGGDCVIDEVKAAAKELERKVQAHKNEVVRAIDAAAKASGLHPHFLWFALFRGPKMWPGTVSRKDENLLRLMIEVYEASGSVRPKSLDALRGGNPGWTFPEESEIQAGFKVLVQEAAKLRKTLLRDWVGIVKQTVPKIQRMCEEVFGETCDNDTAEAILYGDLQRLRVFRRLPVARPEILRYLLGV